MDSFEYVMHGKVFKFKDNSSSGQLKADVRGGLAQGRRDGGRRGASAGQPLAARPLPEVAVARRVG